MVREELKTKGCLFGHLSDINPSLIEELDKLKSIRNPENFTRVTHSYTKIVPSESTSTKSYDDAQKVKNKHIEGNDDGKLWQIFFTWDTENTESINLRNSLIPTIRNLFLEVFKFAYGEEMIDKIWQIGEGNISLTHFDKGCWIDRHADGGSKRVVCNMLIYLNDDWKEEDGGELIVDEKYRQQPLFGNFAVLDFMHVNPFHAVTPIKTEDFHRYTILTGILLEENYFNSIK
jgi:Rps23 Pro-64 3,4-dihydroxylase Tpa1-like proline 4-hydroxylase